MQNHRPSTVDFISALPEELALVVLSFLPLNTIGATLPLVSHRWKRMAEDDSLWCGVASETIKPEGNACSTSADEAHALHQSLGWKERYKQHATADPFYGLRYEFFDPDHELNVAPTLVIMIAVLGPGGVGKSALTVRFVRNIFLDEYDPTIEDIFHKTCHINGHAVRLALCDTADPQGKCRGYPWMLKENPLFFGVQTKELHALMLVYSVTSKSSIEQLHTDYEKFLRECCQEGKKYLIMVVGNKTDLGYRQVTFEEGLQVASELCHLVGQQSILFIETSARDGTNVHRAFCGLAHYEMKRLGPFYCQQKETRRRRRSRRNDGKLCLLT